MTRIIIRDSDGHVRHAATDCFDIVIGEGRARLSISVTKRGWVLVRAMDGNLELRPEANNALAVRVIPIADDGP